MARVCEICSKRTEVGSQVQRRGIGKKQGGIGIRITSREKRKFKANIQRVKVLVGKTPKRMRVCTRCIKSGKVTKR